MNWAQLLYLGLLAASVGMVIAKHGEPKTGHHNLWVTLASAGILIVILYYAGFFRSME